MLYRHNFIYIFILFELCLSLELVAQTRNRVNTIQYNNSALCTRNVNCPEGINYIPDARNCTVYIAREDTFFTSFVTGVGTGVLLNYDLADIRQDGEYQYHYLLVADHVFRKGNYRKWYLVFNYQHPFCSRDRIYPNNRFYQILPPTQLRLELVARSNVPAFDKDDDWVLLRINNNLSSIPGLCLCGWDADPTQYDETGLSTTVPTNLGGVSHPKGDVKKITEFFFNPAEEANGSQAEFGNPGDPIEKGYWTVSPTSGAVQEGSSGSGLVATTTKIIDDTTNMVCINCIIGTLAGTEGNRDECLDSSIYYNKFEVAFASIARFLNPDTTTGLLRSNGTFLRAECPHIVEASCYDNIQNQGENGVDCCVPNGCTVCPPCFPVSGGGENSCIVFASDLELLRDCYHPPFVPQVRFRTRSSGCYDFLRFEWLEQNAVTADINPVPQVINIGGPIKEYTFSWDFHGGLPTFPMTKTYTLRIYDIRNINTLVSADIPVTIYGSAVVNAGNDLSLCVNQTEQLNGQFQGGNYYTNAFWRAMPSQAISYLSNPNIVNPTLTPTQTGTYTYTLEIRDGMNCSGFDEIIVRVDHITRPAELRLGCVVPPDYYHAGRIYTAETCSTTITAPEPTDLVGAQEVNLLPGFTASAGATFTARIAPCDVDENAQAPPPEPRTAQKAVEKTDLKPNSFSYDLFPNPTDGTFTLRYTSTDARLVNVRLYDNIGRLLTETSWHDQNRDFEIDVSRYSAGLYHIYVSDGRQTVVKKLFKR